MTQLSESFVRKPKKRRAESSQDRKQGSPLLARKLFDEALQQHQTGRLAEAEPLYRRVLKLDPQHADSLHLLGVIASQSGRYEDAVRLINEALALRDDNAFYHNNLASAYRNMSRYEEAEAGYRRALAINPRYIDALSNLGAILNHAEKADEAMDCFRRALIMQPEHAGAHFNLGNLFRGQNKLDEAERFFRRTCVLAPHYVEAHVNLGRTLQDSYRFDEATAEYMITLNEKPHSVEALSNLGSVCLAQGKTEEGLGFYQRAIDFSPNFALTYNNLLLTMVYAASVSPEQLAATARDFGARLENLLPRQLPVRDNNPDRRLRIGYVSPDFRAHAVNYFFEPLLTLHDREKFEIFAYSNVAREDDVTERLKRKFDHWHTIRYLDDHEATRLIESDQIDILIDLTGHTGDNRLPVFARKPAPVQVTWLGFPATTGVKAIDYRISDQYAEPAGLTEHLNVEKLWRLPEIFCCYQAHENSPAVIDHPPFEDNGYITFGCFNNFAKVTDPVLEAWAKILALVPDSRLLLEIAGLDSPRFRTDVEQRLQKLGLPPERVILETRKKENQFVLYNRLDIALDPFPCSGGTTSMDTLWMGVPFVTLAGAHFTSRMGVSILSNAGLAELVADNTDIYVEKAVALAQDRNRLRAMRHGLRGKIQHSPLMNQQAFTRHMEDAYRGMWRAWCAENGAGHAAAEG